MVTVKKRGAAPSPKTIRILYKNGVVDHVHAHGFNYYPNQQGDLIKFHDGGKEIEEMLIRAPEVASVIISSRFAEAPPLLALQTKVQNLESRMDALEKNFVDIVAQTLDVVLAKRGLKLSQ